MASHIKIEGDRVTVVEEVVSRVVHLDDWMESVVRGKYPTLSMTLPPNCILTYLSEKRAIFVTAAAPTRRTILRRKDPDTNEYVSSTLALPWVVFVHVFNLEGGLSTHHRTSLFFSNSRPTSWESNVDIPPLHNVGPSDGYVCLGDNFILDMNKSLADKVTEIENHFWLAPFNLDLGPYEDSTSLRNVGGSYKSWESRSRRNAAFIYKQVSWTRDSLGYYVNPSRLTESGDVIVRL